MKRLLVLSVVFAIIVAACAPTTSDPDPTDPPQLTTTSGAPDATSAPTTTAPPVITTSTVDPQAELEEIKALMTEPELAEGGILEANGAFAETTEGFTPFEDLEVFVYDDGENLNFYIEGPADLIRGLVIEFDAQDANGRVVKDTSYVGDQAINPPSWAVEAQNGNTVKAADNPPLEVAAGVRISTAQSASGDRLGALIESEITTLEEFLRLSLWFYWGLEDGRISYAHYIELYENLIRDSSDGVLADASLLSLLGLLPGQLYWFYLGG